MSTRLRYALPSLFVAAVMMIGLTGCDWDDSGASLFDPNFTAERPDPVITEIVPGQTTLAGVGRVTIHGSNFSSNPEENIVLFAEERATVLEASPERLVVRAPNVVADVVPLRVTVLGAMNYAGDRQLRLIPAVQRHGQLAQTDVPQGMTIDPDGNLYVGIIRGTSPQGVWRIDAGTGAADQIVAPQPWTYVDMAYHPDGNIYMVRGVLPVIYRIPLEGGAPQVFQQNPQLGQVNRIEVDGGGNLWVGGGGGNIVRVAMPGGERTRYPFVGDVRGIVYRSGYLYVSAIRDNEGGLWRGSVDASGLIGEFQRLINFEDHSALAGATPADLVVRANGQVLLGTSRANYALLQVEQDGSWSSLYGNLSGVAPTFFSMELGSQNYLYAARQGTTFGIFRIDLQWQEGR
jgi:hypothetical protein